MSRRISQPYRCEPLAELNRQLLYAPPDRRIEQVRRLEKLHDQIDPAVNYPLEFLHYRITRYRLDGAPETLLVGEAVLPDLRLMIDELSRTVDMPLDEPSESEEELAARLDVSTKTVSRWRRQGLRWRWVRVGSSGPRHLVLPRSGVDRFLANNAYRVERAARFSQMTPAVRRRLIERAARIAQAHDVSLNQVATHLAKRTGRAVETIRLVLEHHDAQHPHDRIFEDHTGPLSARQKQLIARAHRMGVRTSTMVRKFKRTRTTIYRVVRDQRVSLVKRTVLNYVHLPIFDRPDADAVLLRTPSTDENDRASKSRRGGHRSVPVADLPEGLREFFTGHAIDDDRQLSLFVRFNYLKHKVNLLRADFEKREPRAADVDRAEAWLEEIRTLRDRFAAANQRVVLDTARRHTSSAQDRSVARLLELVEAGQPVLVNAIEVFDPSRDQTFDSFLRWSLMRAFAEENREAAATARRRVDADAALRRLQSIWHSSESSEHADATQG
ncbi:MAG: hypothetical protein K8S99_09640 [Planctomycetes bacterium]|nr:hypothetical protein [Planctomycetota bacterium]